VQDELDMYDDNTDLFVEIPYLKKRSKIVEIIAAKDIIFAIAQSGLGAAFNQSRFPQDEALSMIQSDKKYVCHLSSAFAFCFLSAVSSKRIAFLNISPDEVLRSLFYNKSNDSLITVSVYAYDSYSTMKCRTTPIE